MARSFLPILLLALAGAAAGFFEAAAPRQEAAGAVPINNNAAAFPAEACGPRRSSSSFDEGLDNPDVASNMKITPSRKCGFCMGVSSYRLASHCRGSVNFLPSISILLKIICATFPPGLSSPPCRSVV